jgi:hypothetical protein
VVDKNNTLIVRNVSEQAHKNLRLLSVLLEKPQGEVLGDVLEVAINLVIINEREELVTKTGKKK